ncbi:MAG: nucleotidyl transferase AbiEii/AbiGii toxin family protein [Chitinophagaceae bacterium]
MLHSSTVETNTLDLLHEFMALEFFKSFNLVGGTALSLQLGHRTSIDLDFFTVTDFDRAEMHQNLFQHFKTRIAISSSVKNTLGVFAVVDGVKVDICFRPYPLLRPAIIEDGIRMWSLEDIAASKIFAISGRAVKKDFWDLDRLLDIFSIEEIASFYDKRYRQSLAISVAKMVLFFDEADLSEAPVCLMGKTWPKVKKGISKKINKQSK